MPTRGVRLGPMADSDEEILFGDDAFDMLEANGQFEAPLAWNPGPFAAPESTPFARFSTRSL